MEELFASVPESPLAARMRPRTLDEFIGQEHIVGAGRLLRRVIQADQLSSLLFYGPPGSGKTTLAQVIANSTKSHFITMNAVLSGVKELRAAIDQAKEQHDLYGRRTTLFVDEVHRWNKAQQDALLPWVENGTVILVGATTENPFFEVNRALVSRSRVFQLKALGEADLRRVALAALADPERGYGKYRVTIEEEALAHLVKISNGDARSLLNAIELAVETTPDRFPPLEGEAIAITRAIAEESIQRKVVLYDKEGDYHFDTISAFIKSVRGSDPDAALYWLARMVHAGEDPHYLLRRMLILASEDVGMADPRALPFVVAAAEAFDRVGLPEGRFHLAQAAVYLATAAKSNSALGFFDALALIESEERAEDVPNHLRDASRDSEGFGHGEGYLYPHAFRDHWVAQQYLPPGLQGRIFYHPQEIGEEARIRSEVVRRRELQLALAAEPPSVEVLTFAAQASVASRWIEDLASGHGEVLARIRDRVFEPLAVMRHDRLLDADARGGLLLWEALRRAPEGGAWGVVSSEEDAGLLEHQMRELPEAERPTLIRAPERFFERPAPSGALAALGLEADLRFEAVVGRNLLTRSSGHRDVFARFAELLAPGGALSLAETVPSMGGRLSGVLDLGDARLATALEAAEERAYRDARNPLVNWRPEALADAAAAAGFQDVSLGVERFSEPRRVTEREIASWLSAESSYGRALREALSEEERSRLRALLDALKGRQVSWSTTVAFLSCRRAS